MPVLKLGLPVDLESLPHREATIEERKKMLGSLATVYEMKNPLLYSVSSGNFYILNHEIIDLDLPEEAELVVLQTNVELPSIFRKWKKRRKLSKKWQ